MNPETLLDRKVRQFRKEGWPDHQIRGYVLKWREVGDRFGLDGITKTSSIIGGGSNARTKNCKAGCKANNR
jgi:hypothetical protein